MLTFSLEIRYDALEKFHGLNFKINFKKNYRSMSSKPILKNFFFCCLNHRPSKGLIFQIFRLHRNFYTTFSSIATHINLALFCEFFHTECFCFYFVADHVIIHKQGLWVIFNITLLKTPKES
jgi:hypothetical protein